ncbi:MAG: Rne/Rng family ribonuclease [Rhodocyclaceae bacterium]|nr:Rne/Rng family ribonuclease [Rhodocyclaceae bacterium]
MKRMLFNATQAEELRVAIVDGQKLIDLDIESASKEQRKSNIYKGVITRVEPSLEAAFVNYGEERHGFLPFKEISRAYFQPGTEPSKARIQDVIKEGQELIVQVEKDERGNKGAALTTFVSLAGRYLVLMPNNPRGGGVSRRVEGEERNELREIMDQLQVPSGMSLIARTAAIGRTAEELQWDLNYLMQLWSAIEGAASQQAGPFLIYLEGSLVIRAIRDYFQPDIGEILIDTDDVFEQARAFMGTVMPGNVGRVKRYRDDVPLFSRFQIEHQIESAYSRQVNLPSGGAVVIDHTEALVACDVNSGRATRGADIEETAFKTNCEAADEIARQLRLRDLGGLIVIDFIDMESSKNQREVENRLRDALRYDRARVQMGKISRFGLMELSRQRLRPALAETSYITCPRCTGTGHIRSTESAALHILRILEEEAMKENTAAVHTQVPVDVATFLLNEKRPDIAAIELRHKVSILLIPNVHLETPAHTIVRLRHDDLNQEDLSQPSYKMVETPLEEVRLAGTQAENRQPRQEAAIKHIAPEQPAPVVDEKPAATPAPAVAAPTPGLIARIVSWFGGGKAAEPAPAPEKKKADERRSGQGRERSRDGQRDGQREGGRGRGRGRGRDEEREAREPKEARPPREAREPKEPRQSAAREEGQTQPGQREGRRQRGEPRPERNRETQQAAAVEAKLTSAAAAPIAADGAAPAEAGGDEARGRRRGRRGGRRERGEGRPEGQVEEAAVAGEALAADDAVPPATEAPAATTVVVAEAAPAPAAVESEAAAPAVAADDTAPSTPAVAALEAAPIVVETPVAAPVEMLPIEIPPVETPVETPVEAAVETTAAVEAAVVEAETATLVESAAEVAAPAQPEPPPAVEPIAVPAPVAASLDVALASSGLVMVETTQDKARTWAPEPAAAPQPRRRKPAPAVASDEPMVMIETRK